MGTPLESEEQRIGRVGANRVTNAITPTDPTNMTVAIVKKWLSIRGKIRDEELRDG